MSKGHREEWMEGGREKASGREGKIVEPTPLLNPPDVVSLVGVSWPPYEKRSGGRRGPAWLALGLMRCIIWK